MEEDARELEVSAHGAIHSPASIPAALAASVIGLSPRGKREAWGVVQSPHWLCQPSSSCTSSIGSEPFRRASPSRPMVPSISSSLTLGPWQYQEHHPTGVGVPGRFVASARPPRAFGTPAWRPSRVM